MIDIKNIKKVAIGSTNPAKTEAVREILDYLWLKDVELVNIKAPSWVSEQPTSLEETLKWAINRAKYSIESDPTIDIAFWLEWWVYFSGDRYFIMGRTACIDRDWELWYGSSNHVEIPKIFWDQVKAWKELWPLTSAYFDVENIAHKEWTIGIYTCGYTPRKESFKTATISALAKWNNKELYEK